MTEKYNLNTRCLNQFLLNTTFIILHKNYSFCKKYRQHNKINVTIIEIFRSILEIFSMNKYSIGNRLTLNLMSVKTQKQYFIIVIIL